MTKSKVLKAIRAFCLECMGGSSTEIDSCTAHTEEHTCPLYELRHGKDPNPSRRASNLRLQRGKSTQNQ